MADKELLERLDQWHEEDQHQRIVDEVKALPPEQAEEYDVRCRLGRALNNTHQFQEALAVLESLRQQGETDSSWWSRMGYALYHLERQKEAADHFRRALELKPDNQDARTFLAWMNVNDNAWGGRAGKKKASQPQETVNGYRQETQTQRRPKASNAANDWEGRGWEGTAALDTTLFGPLRFPVKEGLFQTLPVTLEGKGLMVDLFIVEELAQPDRWEAITALLEGVPAMYRRARERMERDYAADATMEFFIRDQLAELDGEPLLAFFGAARREEISPETFIRRLELKGITIALLADGGMDCTLDFSLDPALTDELLVFRFGQDQEIYDISHES